MREKKSRMHGASQIEDRVPISEGGSQERKMEDRDGGTGSRRHRELDNRGHRLIGGITSAGS